MNELTTELRGRPNPFDSELAELKDRLAVHVDSSLIAKTTFVVPHTWPDIKNAEYEVLQRIEETKIEARRLGQPVADGAIKTACQQVCPADAIVFGDLNDPNSRVAALAESNRAYRVLEDLNTRPAVRYLKLVRHDSTSGNPGNNGNRRG